MRGAGGAGGSSDAEVGVGCGCVEGVGALRVWVKEALHERAQVGVPPALREWDHRGTLCRVNGAGCGSNQIGSSGKRREGRQPWWVRCGTLLRRGDEAGQCCSGSLGFRGSVVGWAWAALWRAPAARQGVSRTGEAPRPRAPPGTPRPPVQAGRLVPVAPCTNPEPWILSPKPWIPPCMQAGHLVPNTLSRRQPRAPNPGF